MLVLSPGVPTSTEGADLGRERLAEGLKAPLRRVVETEDRERVHAA